MTMMSDKMIQLMNEIIEQSHKQEIYNTQAGFRLEGIGRELNRLARELKQIEVEDE